MCKDDSLLSKWKGARHIEETHGMNFNACNYTCHWRKNDMTMIRSLSTDSKRCISQYVLCFPYLPSKGCASIGVFMWSGYYIIPWVPWYNYLIPQSIKSPLACHTSFYHWDTHLCSFRGKWLLQDEALGGQNYAVSRCKADWATEGQNFVFFGENGLRLREGHWMKPLYGSEC